MCQNPQTCATQRENFNVDYELQTNWLHQYWLISCNRCTMFYTMQGFLGESRWEGEMIGVCCPPSAQFFCHSKSVLRKKIKSTILKNRWSKGWRRDSSSKASA
jgi:hypothetical protein